MIDQVKNGSKIHMNPGYIMRHNQILKSRLTTERRNRPVLERLSQLKPVK